MKSGKAEGIDGIQAELLKASTGLFWLLLVAVSGC